MAVAFDFTKVNWDLLVPFIIIFILMRLDVQQRLLTGLRFFIDSAHKVYLMRTLPPTTELHTEAVAAFRPLQYSLLEVDMTFQKKHLIQNLPFFAFYKIVALVGAATALVHIWYESYHCVVPQAQHVSWGIFLAVSLLMLALQCQMNILLLTGLKVFESKASFFTGLLMFVVSAVLLNLFDEFMGFKVTSTVDDMAIHINVLLMQMSAKPFRVPHLILSQVLKLVVASMFGIITAALVVPILRFSQMFITVHFGVESKTTPMMTKFLLWIDLFGPLALAIALCPMTWNFVTRVLPPAFHTHHFLCLHLNEQFCSDVNVAIEPVAQIVQIVLVTVLVSVRLWLVKPYVQIMLDGTARMVLALIRVKAVNETNKPLLQSRLKMIGDYLPAGASQLLTFPFVIIALSILIHRLSPQGTGTARYL
jgi:hypothetical protein